MELESIVVRFLRRESEKGLIFLPDEGGKIVSFDVSDGDTMSAGMGVLRDISVANEGTAFIYSAHLHLTDATPVGAVSVKPLKTGNEVSKKSFGIILAALQNLDTSNTS